jgi:CHASE3 domain sensor protein
MKDVVGCEKLREAAKQALIRRCPNGETQRRESLSCSEYIAAEKLTQGTETSQYLKEEKETSIPPVAASEQGRCLNLCCVKGGPVAV